MMSWMCPRSCSTRAGVNALDDNPRNRVCAGASRKSICFTITLAIGIQRRQSHLVELRGSGRTVGRERQQHFQHIGVTRHYPRMQKRIPMHGILRAHAVKQRIRIRQHLRVEEVVQAHRLIPAFQSCGYVRARHWRPCSPGSSGLGCVFNLRHDQILDFRTTFPPRWDDRITSAASTRRRTFSLTRAITCVPSRECPPSRKKLSFTPTRSTFNNGARIFTSSSSTSVRGSTYASSESRFPFTLGNAARFTFPCSVTGRLRNRDERSRHHVVRNSLPQIFAQAPCASGSARRQHQICNQAVSRPAHLPWPRPRLPAPRDAGPARSKLRSARRDSRGLSLAHPLGREMRSRHWAASAQDLRCGTCARRVRC